MISLFSRIEAEVTMVCISMEWMWYAMEMLDIFLIRLGSCRSSSFCGKSWFTIYFSLGRRSVSLLEFYSTRASIFN